MSSSRRELIGVIARSASGDAIQTVSGEAVWICFAEPVIGPRSARTRWLAMTIVETCSGALAARLRPSFASTLSLRKSRGAGNRRARSEQFRRAASSAGMTVPDDSDDRQRDVP